MKKQQKDLQQMIGKWIVPITKDLESKQEALEMRSFNCEIRIAKMPNKKFVIVRQLTIDDLKSMDFMKCVRSFKYDQIERIEKPKWK
jgi:hypothetical protein